MNYEPEPGDLFLLIAIVVFIGMIFTGGAP